MLIFDKAICGHCRSLIGGILTSQTDSTHGWQTVKSQHAELTYMQRHLENTSFGLSASAKSGCKMCALMADAIRSFYGENVGTEYSIFIWGRAPAKSEFKIANGSVERYLEHIERHSRPLSIGLFQSMPALNNPSSQTLSSSSPSILPHKYPESQEVIDQVKTWLTNCLQKHRLCTRPPSTLPKRVIDLSKSEDLSMLTLYLSHGEVHSYATLSYSWGGKGRRFKTKNATIHERCRGFALEDLPTTLQDGVKVAKALGFRYIWIDSLCIIQDDEKDWIHEGRAMTDIYGNSTLNISASSSTGSDEGFLWSLPNHGVTIGKYQNSATMCNNTLFAGTPLKTLDLEEKEVSHRGWIFQERLVSVSTIHYTREGLIWECVSDTCLKHKQNLTSAHWKGQWNDIVNRRRFNFTMNIENAVSAQDKFVVWHQWVNAYSSRKLHTWTDKFPAIAGVAKTFAEAFNLTWCAGLWRENLIGDLLWRRHNRNPSLVRPGICIAPSWSWASVNGQIEYRQVRMYQARQDFDLDILDCWVEEKYTGSFGEVREGGYLIVEGLVQPVVIDTAFHPGVRQKPYQECVLSRGFKNNSNVLCMLDEFYDGMERFVSCLCLRLTSFHVYGRQGVIYLLIERLADHRDQFRRIGLAETDPWDQGNVEISDSGSFVAGNWQRLILM